MTSMILTDNALLDSIQAIQGIQLDDDPSFTVVNSDSAISDVIDNFVDFPVEPPSTYVDLEGINNSRQVTMSILPIYVQPEDHTYLIDIHHLQHKAFSTTRKQSKSCLKAILESKDIPKAFFDVHNDSDTLFHHFQIKLSGVYDIQLMDLATRKFSRRCANGLQRCIENDAIMTDTEKLWWNMAKEAGLKKFAPEKGG